MLSRVAPGAEASSAAWAERSDVRKSVSKPEGRSTLCASTFPSRFVICNDEKLRALFPSSRIAVSRTSMSACACPLHPLPSSIGAASEPATHCVARVNSLACGFRLVEAVVCFRIQNSQGRRLPPRFLQDDPNIRAYDGQGRGRESRFADEALSQRSAAALVSDRCGHFR
jgi:hypothetical protein